MVALNETILYLGCALFDARKEKFQANILQKWWVYCKVGPLPVITWVITPITRVITPVTQL